MLHHLHQSDLELIIEMLEERAKEIRNGERSGDPMTADDYDDLALRCWDEIND